MNRSWTTGRQRKRINAAIQEPQVQPAWMQQRPQLTTAQRLEALSLMSDDEKRLLGKLLTFLATNAKTDRAVFDVS